jgi:hypothetical protein
MGKAVLRKQLANTSSSFASAQIFRPWLRQKARLQSAQVGLWWCCFSFSFSFSAEEELSSSRRMSDESAGRARRKRDGDWEVCSERRDLWVWEFVEGGLRATMVLLVKQTHLQKEVALLEAAVVRAGRRRRSGRRRRIVVFGAGGCGARGQGEASMVVE